MVEFMKKAMDWVLEKEADAAKNCHAKPEDIEKQIKMIEEKRESLKKRYEDDISELEHVLNKLHYIKAESLKCDLSKQRSI
jgi:chaperonin cofactor prefoldin